MQSTHGITAEQPFTRQAHRTAFKRTRRLLRLGAFGTQDSNRLFSQQSFYRIKSSFFKAYQLGQKRGGSSVHRNASKDSCFQLIEPHFRL